MLDFLDLLAPGETVDAVLSDDVSLDLLAAGCDVANDRLGMMLFIWRRASLAALFASWGEECEGGRKSVNLL